ncbi:MAG TPA: sigma-70 family RNA polymerase sigma factor [Bryobacteraceae bacterium]|jgi:RNA polymerase sigma-70 factor (ECF subfamily)|nr:sigma-70 family RNA polymerase sigma factor [Bryobacteraceae bacterium]
MDSQQTLQMQNTTIYADIADEKLVKLCQHGDNAAFAELMSRHKTAASKLALSILRDKSDAEDEVQNAFWKAYEHINQFQQEAKFSTWFTRIVVNQCLMRLRQMRRARFCFLDDTTVSEEAVAPDLPDKRRSPEQELGHLEITRVLREEIKRIPPLLRNVLMLRDVHQRPMPEVAGELGISVAAAKSRLLRARAELRQRMKRHCGATGEAVLLI